MAFPLYCHNLWHGGGGPGNCRKRVGTGCPVPNNSLKQCVFKGLILVEPCRCVSTDFELHTNWKFGCRSLVFGGQWFSQSRVVGYLFHLHPWVAHHDTSKSSSPKSYMHFTSTPNRSLPWTKMQTITTNKQWAVAIMWRHRFPHLNCSWW